MSCSGFLVYTRETSQAVYVDSDDIEVAARVAHHILRNGNKAHVSISKVVREYRVIPPGTFAAVPFHYGGCPPDAVVFVDMKEYKEDGSVKNMTIPMMVGVAKFHP